MQNALFFKKIASNKCNETIVGNISKFTKKMENKHNLYDKLNVNITGAISRLFNKKKDDCEYIYSMLYSVKIKEKFCLISNKHTPTHNCTSFLNSIFGGSIDCGKYWENIIYHPNLCKKGSLPQTSCLSKRKTSPPLMIENGSNQKSSTPKSSEYHSAKTGSSRKKSNKKSSSQYFSANGRLSRKSSNRRSSNHFIP